MLKKLEIQMAIAIGKVNTFIVNRETSSGYYLLHEESNEEVFLPPSMAPLKIKIDQLINAFVYTDTKGMLIATSETPMAEVGEFAYLSVADTSPFGAFMEWGIEKDLLVPGNQQKIKIRKFEEHIVRICLEEETNRVYGTTKLGKYIENQTFEIQTGDKVQMKICDKTPLGHKVIINKIYIGMIYHNEIFSDISIGKTYSGVVKKLRDDGLIDASLQTQGVQNLHDSKSKIIDYLKNNEGISELSDKSPASEIALTFGISKQSFKKAIGMLYKERQISISKEGIKLNTLPNN